MSFKEKQSELEGESFKELKQPSSERRRKASAFEGNNKVKGGRNAENTVRERA